MTVYVEVCAGSLEDCAVAQQCGADRIELNNAIHLGGLTPSIATLIEAKKITTLPIITMVRARPGGFHYNAYEIQTMITDAKYLLEHGSDGLVFGFLDAFSNVDKELTRRFVELAHTKGVEAIFHRAFDRASDPIEAIEDLIACGVDRVLTSGQASSADQGIALLAKLQTEYGSQIEFCVGAGVNVDNANEIVAKTGISQVHSSFKGWFIDPTTASDAVSYSYSESGDYEGVDTKKLKTFLETVK
ncbi:copper homeostasis protein CutC [Erysipelothrix sp. HDW6C]|uniref:copper homeostasis protein CutC n=1 Tax=Erysipelothrix sp. HDW6C TaxID=2714930 RepID=UPI00140CB17F|nr:copper homeostasis protein CutC [Erysipelothrix sp. HDW6C]QIK68947.1 copper homeostasis protein CutC [Erysipelothrix sp. HDW6C]